MKRNNGQLVLRLDQWRVEIAGDHDWTRPGGPSSGVGRVTDAERLALEKAGYGRATRVRSEWATISDSEVTAAATLPAGNY